MPYEENIKNNGGQAAALYHNADRCTLRTYTTPRHHSKQKHMSCGPFPCSKPSLLYVRHSRHTAHTIHTWLRGPIGTLLAGGLGPCSATPATAHRVTTLLEVQYKPSVTASVVGCPKCCSTIHKQKKNAPLVSQWPKKLWCPPGGDKRLFLGGYGALLACWVDHVLYYCVGLGASGSLGGRKLLTQIRMNV